jgi:predicted PolB exonuclease-like 3'-5' exonuclease
LDQIWTFDCEWAPDITAGRRLYHLPPDVPDDEVLRVMWQEGGATPEDPQPFLKTLLCRVVSIAMVVRKVPGPGDGGKGVELKLVTLPSLDSDDPEDPSYDERRLLRTFLSSWFAKCKPVFVGFNSRNADLHILAQRAIVNGVSAPEFAERVAAKPWNSPDVDLVEIVGGRGRSYACTLHEIANLCGIPGKLDTTGDDVAGLFYGGKLRRIVEYNAFDALTTYLVWLRTELFAGRLTPESHAEEERRLRDLVMAERAKPHGEYLSRYLAAWDSQNAAPAYQ